jgi:hypothetical protein
VIVEVDPPIEDPIQHFADIDFRWGDVQAIKYDATKTEIFPAPYLFHLYERTRKSGRAKMGSLPVLFCGMLNLSADAICAYLSQRPVCVVGEWRKHTFMTAKDPDDVDKPYFHDLGFCFPSVNPTVTQASNVYNPQNSCMAGYTFFQDAWKTPQQTICMYLGLAWLFHTFQLAAMHGQRYADNHLTARFTRRFGFKDVGTASHMLLREQGQPLVPMTLSTLLRSDFVDLTRQVLNNAREESANGRNE